MAKAGKRTSDPALRVHINIAGLMPVASVSGGECVYVVVDDYTRAAYARWLLPAAVEGFKGSSREVEENEPRKRILVIMMDDARELSMGEICDIYERNGIKLHPMVPYRPTSKGIAERRIRVFTDAVRAMLPTLLSRGFLHTNIHSQQGTDEGSGLMHPYKVLYAMKLNPADLRAFSTPMA